MRGQENPQLSMFSYLSLEHRIPADHPLRRLRLLVDGLQPVVPLVCWPGHGRRRVGSDRIQYQP